MFHQPEHSFDYSRQLNSKLEVIRVMKMFDIFYLLTWPKKIRLNDVDKTFVIFFAISKI